MPRTPCGQEDRISKNSKRSGSFTLSHLFFGQRKIVLTSGWAQKRTAGIERRETVELIISEENDYGIGNGTVAYLFSRLVYDTYCYSHVPFFFWSAAYWLRG